MNTQYTRTHGTIITRETLVKIWLDYRNEYLTIDKFAEHYGLYAEEAQALIDLCKAVTLRQHPES